jgi:hypothetical protein
MQTEIMKKDISIIRGYHPLVQQKVTELNSVLLSHNLKNRGLFKPQVDIMISNLQPILIKKYRGKFVVVAGYMTYNFLRAKNSNSEINMFLITQVTDKEIREYILTDLLLSITNNQFKMSSHAVIKNIFNAFLKDENYSVALNELLQSLKKRDISEAFGVTSKTLFQR